MRQTSIRRCAGFPTKSFTREKMEAQKKKGTNLETSRIANILVDVQSTRNSAAKPSTGKQF